jgi:hypothetical protein
MRRVYPDRLTPVVAFLDADPRATAESPGRVKEHAWAYMAKWWGRHNCDDFYQAVWRDDRLRAALEALLASIGAPTW